MVGMVMESDNFQGQLMECKRCQRNMVIYAKELCKSCYNYNVLSKEKRRQYWREWKRKNPDYFKLYRKKKNEDKQ